MTASGQELIFADCSATAVLLVIAVWILLKRVRTSAARAQSHLRTELECRMDSQHADCCAQLAQLAANVAVLEMSSREIEEAKGGLSRSMRSAAMQLLRSGISPDNAAKELSVARNEMRLIAAVADVLQRS